MSAVALPTARQPSCDGDGEMLISTSVESSINPSCFSSIFATSGPHNTSPVTDVLIVSDEPFAVDDPRRPPQPQQTITLSWTMEPLPPPDSKQPISSIPSKKTSLLHSVKLPKKPSMQSLFTPSFLQQPPPLTDSPPPLPVRARSFSAVQPPTNDLFNHPLLDIPAPSLLDDDPFANLTSSHIPYFTESPTSFEHPILSEVPRPSTVVVSPRVYVPPATVARPRSSGQGQVRPAYTRPAFTTRPSLPSLHTLAQMNVTIPRKVRKGTPGARLPHEPWNMDLSAQFNIPTRNVPSVASSRFPDNRTSSSPASTQEITGQPEDHTTPIRGDPDSRYSFREIELAPPAVADEARSSRSLSGDDADMDSLPSLSYTTSEPSSSALSRSSSMESSPWLEGTMHQNSSRDNHDRDKGTVASVEPHAADEITEDDDPLSYHSDFDYYTQSLSDLSDSELDLDPASDKTVQSSSPDVALTPQLPTSRTDVDFEPGTSAETMRNNLRERLQTAGRFIDSPTVESPQDGGEWRGRRGEPERQNGGGDERRGRDMRRSNGGYSGGGGAGGAGGDDNKGDKPHQRKSHSIISTASDSTSSSDDDADGGTVYYSLDGMSNGPPSRAQSRTQSRHSKAGGGSDDDVPLAQRVPTALSAQKSIRRQLRDEREQKKLERAKSSRVAAMPPPPPLPLESGRTPAPPPTSYRKRSASAAPAPASRSRAPSIEPFPAEDLTRKLMNLQVSSHTPPASAPLSYTTSTSPLPSSRAAAYGGGISRSSSRGKHMDPAAYGQQKTTRTPEASSQDRPLRSMRSFHRANGRYSESQGAYVEPSGAPQLGRSTTVAGSSRSARGGEIVSAGYDQYAKLGRTSDDTRRPSASAPRPSMDRESDAGHRVVQRPPLPPLPIPDPIPPQQPIPRAAVVQQRIFIGDMQRFNMVEITPSTSAGDVIDIVASQGMLDRSGSWMLFELAQDYGMERPIRDYELLVDVSASWNKDKLLNAFVIKPTSLAHTLSRSAIPTSSPTHRGWVEWESKRGKWSKRWMELREHGLWLSKRDTGKDEVFLCSLSNFDAYLVTRRHKAPKAFVFAIKSTDHLSLFENAADYLHVFSCNPKDGEKWMQVILVARSYVLYQERHVLFAKTGESLSQSKPLQRSRTRKQSVSARPAQPLVTVPPPFSQSPTANVAFEPGSLLAKRKGDMQP